MLQSTQARSRALSERAAADCKIARDALSFGHFLPTNLRPARSVIQCGNENHRVLHCDSDRLGDVGIAEIDLLQFHCEGAEYLFISELATLGLMDRLG